MKPNTITKFWTLYAQDKRGCWRWLGSTNGHYGRYRYQNHTHIAHRLAYETAKGPIPPGKVVMHLCDNTFCINPKHLNLGTQADNIQDKVLKNRQVQGERCHTSKLTVGQVKAIRGAYVSLNLQQKELADMFGVSKRTMGHIVKGRSWKSAK
jgi:DNA-binding XRE family transcriptional regulator